MEEIPKYYTIMPAKIRYDDELTLLAKVLFSEILTLSMLDGYCYASNNYFAKLYNTKKETISRTISMLVDKKYIELEIIYKGKRIISRHLKVSDDLLTKISIPIDKKVNTPIDKKVKDNNTSNNNINRIYNTTNKFYGKDNITDIRKYYDNFKEV